KPSPRGTSAIEEREAGDGGEELRELPTDHSSPHDQHAGVSGRELGSQSVGREPCHRARCRNYRGDLVRHPGGFQEERAKHRSGSAADHSPGGGTNLFAHLSLPDGYRLDACGHTEKVLDCGIAPVPAPPPRRKPERAQQCLGVDRSGTPQVQLHSLTGPEHRQLGDSRQGSGHRGRGEFGDAATGLFQLLERRRCQRELQRHQLHRVGEGARLRCYLSGRLGK
ncbi:MAG TPA: hypothetical protein VGS18_01745, partial [Thermoplasmata archaeon]|nr:hypothetical protein [Thermoplasmata archaeon]